MSAFEQLTLVRGLTELIITSEHAYEFPAISKDHQDLLCSTQHEMLNARLLSVAVNSLSTRSTNEPDVVNGIRASMSIAPEFRV